MSLTDNEKQYYIRQIDLSEVGKEGQLKLKNAKVLCIGAGGLGAPLLQYLAAAGVGTIGIIDHDVVEVSNLSRQLIYKYNDIGKKKVIAAQRYLIELNPFITINIYPKYFDAKNALSIINDYDIVADCTDNLINRYITNQVCIKLGKPFIFAGIWRYQGQVMLFDSKEGPCFNCVFPSNHASHILPNCNDAGVLGVVPGILGIIQANLIIQYILQISQEKLGKLFSLNMRDLTLTSHYIERDLECAICSVHPYQEVFPSSYGVFVQTISMIEMLNKVEKGEQFTLLDVRSIEEHTALDIGGLLIPLPELEKNISKLDKAHTVIVYCQSGYRSQAAANILLKHHFVSVFTLSDPFSERVANFSIDYKNL
jgi:molybdopterin/thiamine biosynthesis adenylyltransferase/rhodanese-related sulfurtransferase